MTPPYSLEQAKYICSLYQRLIGVHSDGSKVEDVLIIPFDQASKQRFILYYMVMSQDAQDVVLQEYKGFLFDVIVISRNAAGDISHKDLAQYIGSDNVSEDTNGYSPSSSTSSQMFFTDALV